MCSVLGNGIGTAGSAAIARSLVAHPGRLSELFGVNLSRCSAAVCVAPLSLPSESPAAQTGVGRGFAPADGCGTRSCDSAAGDCRGRVSSPSMRLCLVDRDSGTALSLCQDVDNATVMAMYRQRWAVSLRLHWLRACHVASLGNDWAC